MSINSPNPLSMELSNANKFRDINYAAWSIAIKLKLRAYVLWYVVTFVDNKTRNEWKKLDDVQVDGLKYGCMVENMKHDNNRKHHVREEKLQQAEGKNFSIIMQNVNTNHQQIISNHQLDDMQWQHVTSLKNGLSAEKIIWKEISSANYMTSRCNRRKTTSNYIVKLIQFLRNPRSLAILWRTHKKSTQ